MRPRRPIPIRAAAYLVLSVIGGAGAARSQNVLVPNDWSSVGLKDFSAVSNGLGRSSQIRLARTAPVIGRPVLPVTTDSQLTVGSKSGKQTAAAIALPAFNLRKATQDFLNRVSVEGAGKTTFLSDLRLRLSVQAVSSLALTGSFTKLWDARGAGLQTATAQAGQLDQNEVVAAAILRATKLGFPVRADELQLLKAAQPASSPALAGFQVQYNKALATLSDAIVQPDAGTASMFADQVKVTDTNFVALWPTLRHDPVARGEAVHRLDALKAQSALKAIYGLPSSFLPASYGDIARQSRRTVSLVIAGSAPCSGLLIDDEWVVSAGHCMANTDYQSLRIALDDEDGHQILLAVDDEWPRSGHGENDGDPIDYVFLHLVGSPASAPVVRNLEQKDPLCLASMPADYREPVIVIARRDSDPTRVYDNAHVWFPFRVGPVAYNELAAETGAKLQRLAESWYPDDKVGRDRFFETNMSSFEDSYVAEMGAFREYRTTLHDLGPRPYFGMDTDTVHGNSGAPVFSRQDVCVVGIFSGGQSDGAQIQEGTWAEQEFAMPWTEVDKDLRALATNSDGATSTTIAARIRLLAILTAKQR